MPLDSFSYQSAETAWRYDTYMSDAKRELAEAERALASALARIAWLEAHPPLSDLFNWSA